MEYSYGEKNIYYNYLDGSKMRRLFHLCSILLLSILILNPNLLLYTVNVDIFVQYICSRISRRALHARKYDVSENYNHERTNRNKQHMRENV